MQIPYRFLATIVVIITSLAACKPNEPPPDLIKTQREVLQKSKAVEGQLQQQAEEQKKTVEDAAK